MTHTAIVEVGVGSQAPPFLLDAITREGRIGLSDYRGRGGLFLNLVRGLHCPFCRRHLTQLAGTAARLADIGIETLVVVSTTLERAHAYLRYRPTPLTVASDPETDVHSRYGLPRFAVSDAADDWPRNVNTVSIATPLPDPAGELGPAPLPETVARLNEKDGYAPEVGESEVDIHASGILLEGRFLIDRDGIIRWRHIEAEAGPQDFAKTPSPGEVLEVARGI